MERRLLLDHAAIDIRLIGRVLDDEIGHDIGQIRAIADIQIGYLRKRLADRQIELEITSAALDKLGEAGFDPVYGARPLKRAIQQELENPLARHILAGEFGPGDTVVVEADTRANLTLLDPARDWTFDERSNLSKAKNSPWFNRDVKGKVIAVFNNGRNRIDE